MRVAITGAAGGIGSVLSDRLRERGHDLLLLDDLSTGSPMNFTNLENRDSLRICDITRASELPEELAGCEAIVHLAAVSSLVRCQSDPGLAWSVNVGGTAVLADAARRSGALFINASTSAVYERSSTLPYRESDVVAPILTYAQTKRASELMLQQMHALTGFPSVTLRFFNVFGSRQDLRRAAPPLVNYLVREVALGRVPKIYAPDFQGRDYVHVDDVVDLIEFVLRTRTVSAEILNVCSGNPISIQEIIGAVSRGLGTDVVPERGSPHDLWELAANLFEGPFPLPLHAVSAETLKQSVGDPRACFARFGWQARRDVLKAIAAEAPAIVERARAAAKQ